MIGKTPGLKGMGMGLMLGFSILAGCTKEVSTDSAVATAGAELQPVQQVAEASFSDSALAKFFKVPFSTRGSRTTFRGYVSDTTATISLDYRIDKTFTRAGDKKLFLDYGDYSLYSRGWKYEIRYNNKTWQVLLAPNDVMVAQTEPGSFKTVAATFDKTTSTFTFLTEVKDLDGFVHQVTDIATRK